jgi:hypothetical protein
MVSAEIIGNQPKASFQMPSMEVYESVMQTTLEK